jgi:hypothetical protein
VLQHAPWQRDSLARIAKEKNHSITVQCFVGIRIKPPKAASVEDSLVGSLHRMVINLVAVVLVAEAPGEVVANLEAMVLAEGEVLGDRIILPLTKVTGIPTSATTALRTL